MHGYDAGFGVRVMGMRAAQPQATQHKTSHPQHTYTKALLLLCLCMIARGTPNHISLDDTPCRIIITANGRDGDKGWLLEGGVRDHWSEGTDVVVVDSDEYAFKLILAASCLDFARAECHVMLEDAGKRITALQISALTEDGVDMTIPNLPDNVYRVTVSLEEYNYTSSVIFAKLSPKWAVPHLEVNFPPESGYVFGVDVEPFIQWHVQSKSVLSKGRDMTERGSPYYVRVHVWYEGNSQDVGNDISNPAEVVKLDIWSPNWRKLFLGTFTTIPGQYRCYVQVLDVLKRDLLVDEYSVHFTVSSERTPQACVPGDLQCIPQTARVVGSADLLSRDLDVAGLLDECGDGAEDLCGLCQYGQCVGGMCVCDPDWIGRDCDHNTLTQKAYVPSVHPSDRANRCHQTNSMERGMDALFARVNMLQYPSNCDRVFHRRFNKTQGLGVTLRWLAMSLSVSLSLNKTLVVGGRWRAFNYEGCSHHGVWCVLSHISNCTVKEWDWQMDASDSYMPDKIVIPFSGMEQGKLWWSSVMMHAVMRPSLAMEARLRRLKNTMKWLDGKRVLGLHVRHGDSCADPARPPCIPAAKYFEEAERVASTYHINVIYLATDDEEVVGQASERAGYRYMSLRVNRSALFSSHMFIEHRLNLGTVDRQGVSESTFLDLFLLSDCQAFVGTFGSHFSKVAYELMVAKSGDFMPFSSLDMPWTPLREIVDYSDGYLDGYADGYADENNHSTADGEGHANVERTPTEMGTPMGDGR